MLETIKYNPFLSFMQILIIVAFVLGHIFEIRCVIQSGAFLSPLFQFA